MGSIQRNVVVATVSQDFLAVSEDDKSVVPPLDVDFFEDLPHYGLCLLGVE